MKCQSIGNASLQGTQQEKKKKKRQFNSRSVGHKLFASICLFSP